MFFRGKFLSFNSHCLPQLQGSSVYLQRRPQNFLVIYVSVFHVSSASAKDHDTGQMEAYRISCRLGGCDLPGSFGMVRKLSLNGLLAEKSTPRLINLFCLRANFEVIQVYRPCGETYLNSLYFVVASQPRQYHDHRRP